MFAESYAPSFEDFSANDLTKLDLWVFDKVESFFNAAREDVNLQLKLRQDKVVLFLHLLGLDTNGHRNKPGSKAYADNIRVVDEGVKRTVEVVDRYWRNDGRTAFIFTADHGMTDWGSHGAGMAHETETPLLAWGAGVRRARNISAVESTSPTAWALPHVERDDVEQADIAPLMSVLLGASVPRNSVGKLPSGYLDMHPEHKVEAAVTVAKQMNEQLRSLRDRFADARIHKPFPDLGAGAFEKRLERIGLHVRAGKYTVAQRLADGLFADALRGVEYYHKYFRLQLFVAVSASYVGLILLISVKLLKDFTPFGSGRGQGADFRKAWRLDAATILTAVILVIMSVSQNAPWHYLVYFLCPVAIWNMALRDAATLTAVRVQREHVLMFLLVLACLEVTVVSFFRRQALSAVIVTVALLLIRPSRSAWMKHLWMAFNVCLCVFTFQPSVGKDRSNLLVFAGSLVSAVAFAVTLSLASSGGSGSGASLSSVILPSYLVLSGICVWLSSSTAPLVPIGVVHLASWFMFLTAIPAAIAFTKATVLPRLVALCMALQVCYILLSLSYEGLFLLCLMATLGTFLVMEHAASYMSHQPLSVLLVEPADARERNIVEFKDVLTAFMFLHFSVVSFFGTGNIASLNSFDPRSIACLVSIFSPFLMGSLLLFKVGVAASLKVSLSNARDPKLQVLLPFLVVACFMYAVRRVNRMNSRALFLLVLLFSDFLGLHFFFLVRDNGSWEEIGTSLSHYVIAEATVIFLQLLFVAAGWMLKFSCGGGGKRERVEAAFEGLEIDQSNRL